MIHKGAPADAVRRKRKGLGPRKGSRFEREVSKKLSLWISGGARDDVFWRTAMSGGRATIGLKSGIKRSAQAGDIAAIDSLGERLLNHVIIDAKSYRDVNFMTGILNDRGRLYSWWHDWKLYADKFNKRPMLIVRQNNMPDVCLLTPISALMLFGLNEDHVSAVLPRWGCYVVLFDSFLREAASPELVIPVEPKRRVRLS